MLLTPRPSHRVFSSASQPSSSSREPGATTTLTTSDAPRRLDLVLDTQEAFKEIEFSLAGDERAAGGVVVVVARAGGAAAQEGLADGRRWRLAQLSDPVRETEMWTVGARPSLSRIRDALRMRRSRTVRLVFEEAAAAAAAAPAASAAASPPSASSPSSAAESTLDGLLGSVDEEEGERQRGGGGVPRPSASPSSPSPPPALTIGDRMALQQKAAEAATRGVRERNARRRAYLDDQDERATSGGGGARFLLAAAAAFVLPAAAILLWAFAAGLLEPGRFVGPA